MISGKLPYGNIRAKSLFADFAIMYAIRRKTLPAKPSYMDFKNESLWNICLACWTHDPVGRLTANGAKSWLASIELPRKNMLCGPEKSLEYASPKVDHEFLPSYALIQREQSSYYSAISL